MGQPEMIIFGDAEAAVVDILQNDTPELPHFPPNPPLTITTNLVGYEPDDRWIEVVQEGASMTWPKIQRVRIDLMVYAERRSVAKDICEICLASLMRSMGDYRGFGLFISDCKLEQGATRVPDKLQETSRYVAAVRLTIVPSGPPLSVQSS
jgi:hypothetical protein